MQMTKIVCEIQRFQDGESLYRKIPIIGPGLIFVQKPFLLGLFSEGLIIGNNFALQSGLALTTKTA